ncbi:hypothetical protein ACIQNU_07605 [Streptomyces sp. NPDC091292]|uniref:hypothetical protein n=1 Tax=Streptomyces sp. NPDC091292 TaxID=3365991 RepID=UPI0038180F8E
MPRPHGFSYVRHADGTVVITHHGRPAGTLRAARAERFLSEVESGDAQLVMARWTGAYKHGNERAARQHPRNHRRT